MPRFHAAPAQRHGGGPRSPARASGIAARVDTSGNRRRRDAVRMLGSLAVVLFVIPAAVVGGSTWEGSSRGLLDLRARGSEIEATRLVPEPERIGYDRRFLAATAAAGLQAWNGPVAVTGAGRLRARTSPREDVRAVRLHVDELYVEYAASPEHFLHAGRRHIVHGRSLGVNPLDVGIEPLDLDQALDAERRRAEIEGQDMIGIESLLGQRLTLTGYRTPGERTLLAGTITMPEWDADLAALVFDDERPGAGLSLSHTLGDALLAYADIAVRRGRDRTMIRAERGPDAAPGAFLVEDDDASRFFAQSSVGVGYTLEVGATFNLEYYFDANGYSNEEWDEIIGLIAANERSRNDERLREGAAGNLLRLSGHLRRLTSRRHYGFFRARHPGLFGRALAAEMTVFHNLADRTGSLGLRLERALGPNILLGVEGRCLYGGDLDEFALRAARRSGSVHLTINF